jgi:uncharacterized DUF497 family protein
MNKALKVKFSKHAVEKLDDPTSKKLGITAELIKEVLKKPDLIDNSEYPILIAVGKLTENLSLCIVYKFTEKDLRIITFFPAKRGRYEGKILSRR